jgi:hypothetical protein
MNTWQRGVTDYSQPPGGYGGDTNPSGAAYDPFAYTNGSLLTPWEGRFSSGGYGGGYSAPEFTPYNYADFGYSAPSAGRFEENYADPAAFRFADFAGPASFKAPTAEAMKMDPGYQARMDAVKNAQVAGAAHGGVLRSGGFQKGLAQAVGNQASQEYGNVYNRAASEHDRKWGQAKDTYGINQSNTKSAFDTNTANTLAGHNTRQNDWAGNANIAIQEGQLGYNIAQGTWDRNEQKARRGWEDEASHRQAVASAASANANQSYQRDLDDYMRSRDEFWTNQDRQYAIGTNERNFAYGATQDYADRMMNAYGTMGDYGVGAGDARAAGHVAAGQNSPWGSVLDAAGAGMQFAGMYSQPKAPVARPGAPSMPYQTNSGIAGGRMPGTNTGVGPTLPSRSFSGSGYSPYTQSGVMGARP